MNVHVSRLLKEELAWAIDKQLQVISNHYNVSYTTKKIKNKAVLNLKQYTYCLRCYVAFSNIYQFICMKMFIHYWPFHYKADKKAGQI